MNGGYGIVNSLRPKLRHLPTDCTYLMTMTIVVVTGFILSRSLKAVAYHQTKLHEKLQRIIESSPADGKAFFIIQFFSQPLQCEVIVHIVDSIQNSKALWGFPQIVLFQIIGQYIFDRCLDIIFHFMWLNRKNRTKLLLFLHTTARII